MGSKTTRGLRLRDEESHMGAQKPSMFGQRILLCMASLALVGLAAALISAGIDGRKDMDGYIIASSAPTGSPASSMDVSNDGDLGAWMLGDPYTSLVVCGAALIVLSILGCCGAASANVEVLFWFYAPAFVMIAIIVYLGSFCFIFAADQTMYMKLVQTLLSVDAKISFQETHASLIRGGAFSLVTVVVLLLSLWSSSSIMGHDYALRSMAISMNFLTLGFGLFLLYLAVLVSLAKQTGQYAAVIVAILGALTSALSLLGFCGLAKESRILLTLHVVVLIVISSALVAAAAVCFVLRRSAEEYIRGHWDVFADKVANVSMEDAYNTVANHLLLIAVAALILVLCLGYNLGASILILRTKWGRTGEKVFVVDDDEAEAQRVPLKRSARDSIALPRTRPERRRSLKNSRAPSQVVLNKDSGAQLFYDSSSEAALDKAALAERQQRLPFSDSEATTVSCKNFSARLGSQSDTDFVKGGVLSAGHEAHSDSDKAPTRVKESVAQWAVEALQNQCVDKSLSEVARTSADSSERPPIQKPDSGVRKAFQLWFGSR